MAQSMKARIAYTGDALVNGEMDIRELAPALLAFTDLVEHAYQTLGGSEKIRVLLNQDSLKKGSFDVTMLLDVDWLQQFKLFGNQARDSGLADLMEVLGWGGTVGGGIFWLLKKIRGRKITSIEDADEYLQMLHLEDGESIQADRKIVKILVDVDCRISIEKIVEPLAKDGIDGFELRRPNEETKEAIERISKEDATHFKAPPAASGIEELPPSPEMELHVKITSVNFKKGNKWQLTDGNNTFWASIRDEEFLRKVDEGTLSFANGDMLHIKYHVQQSNKNGALSSEYIVTNVMRLTRRPKQIELGFEYKE